MHSALMLLALTSAFLAEWDSEAGMDSAMVRSVLFVSLAIILVMKYCISYSLTVTTTGQSNALGPHFILQ